MTRLPKKVPSFIWGSYDSLWLSAGTLLQSSTEMNSADGEGLGGSNVNDFQQLYEAFLTALCGICKTCSTLE